jgi:hypothetical protein
MVKHDDVGRDYTGPFTSHVDSDMPSPPSRPPALLPFLTSNPAAVLDEAYEWLGSGGDDEAR